MAVPHLEGFFRSLGESEIGNPGEALLDSVVTVGGQQLKRADDTEFIQQIAANFVLPAFAAIQGELQCRHAMPARFKGEHASVFVVGVRHRVHEPCRGMQAPQHLLKTGVAAIDRKRLGVDPGRRDLRKGRGRQEREKQAQPDSNTYSRFTSGA